MTRPELAGVAALAILGVVLAMMSRTAPTGQPAVDVVERCLVVVGVTVAGARARRAPLLLGAAVLAPWVSGLWRVVPVTALVVIGALSLMGRRDRLAGALAGGAIGVAAMHLDASRPAALGSILGMSAIFGVALSGWRNSRSRQRAFVRPILAGVLAALCLAGVATALFGIRHATRLESAATYTRRGVERARDGQTAEAASDLQRAAADFDLVAGDAGSWWMWPARLVPGLAQNLNVVGGLAQAGSRLGTAAADSALHVHYEDVRRPEGGVDLGTLVGFGKPIRRADDALQAARATLAGPRSNWLVPQVAAALTEFDRRADTLSGEFDLANLAVAGLPRLLGWPTPRRYLVMFGSPAESRDLGGLIGNWALLDAEAGRLTVGDVQGPLDMFGPDPGQTLLDPTAFPAAYLGMQPEKYPQNWSGTPDLPTVARLAAELVPVATGKSIDGVIYTDPATLAALLQLTGPVDVPAVGHSIDRTNAVDFFLKGQYAELAQNESGDAALGDLVHTVFDRFTSNQLPAPTAMSELFSPLVHASRLRFASIHPEDAALLDRLGLQGALPEPSGEDMFGVLTTNKGANKLDAYLERKVRYAATWNPETGKVEATAEITLRNAVPSPESLPPVVVGNGIGAPPGTSVTSVSVLTALALDGIEVDGSPFAPASFVEGGLERHTVGVHLAPGQTATIRVRLRGLVSAGLPYRLRVVGQPAAIPGTVEAVVTSATGSVSDASAGPVARKLEATFAGDVGGRLVAVAATS